MSRSTRATQALDRAGIAFRIHVYDYDPDADSIGLYAAHALGVDPARLLKTLMIEIDGKPACAILPSDRELSLKKAAAVLQGKSAAMMRPIDAERLTGYRVGGISPFGQKKRVPAVLERSVLAHATVILNGGQRGLQIEMAPDDLVTILSAVVADVTANSPA